MEFKDFVDTLVVPPNPYCNLSDCTWSWMSMNEEKRNEFAKLFCKDIQPNCEISKRMISFYYVYLWFMSFEKKDQGGIKNEARSCY